MSIASDIRAYDEQCAAQSALPCVDCGDPSTGNAGGDALCDACGERRNASIDCCHVGESGTCPQAARFVIAGATPRPDDVTYSCGDHVKDLRRDGDKVTRLSDGKEVA